MCKSSKTTCSIWQSHYVDLQYNCSLRAFLFCWFKIVCPLETVASDKTLIFEIYFIYKPLNCFHRCCPGNVLWGQVAVAILALGVLDENNLCRYSESIIKPSIFLFIFLASARTKTIWLCKLCVLADPTATTRGQQWHAFYTRQLQSMLQSANKSKGRIRLCTPSLCCYNWTPYLP